VSADVVVPAVVAPVALDLSERPLRISAADAGDVQKYRRARALAAEAGQPLVIDPPVEEKWTPPPGTLVFPRGLTHAEYRARRADAIARGLPYCIDERTP